MPDLAGLRRERVPTIPATAYFTFCLTLTRTDAFTKGQSRYRRADGLLFAAMSTRRLSAIRAADAFTESRARCA